MTDIFDFTPAPQYFAVMGNPVAHSRSPPIHEQFARQFGIRLEYARIQVDPGGFPQAVSNFEARGGRGVNVTVPFKNEAWQLADACTPRADLARAVNTLSLPGDGRRLGDNTDGAGLVRDIGGNLAQPIADRRVLLVGAGGAAQGVLGPLLAEHPCALWIVNRTVDKAEALAERFAAHGAVSAGGFAALAGRRFDIVINATSASLSGAVPPLPADVFADGALAYDMMYANQPTAFLCWARGHGARRTADGFGMLVEQAAESFALWHGHAPETAQVIAALRPYAPNAG